MTDRILKSHKEKGFSMAEVSVALLVAALFAGAVFATNQRLFYSLKSQRESTAATMMLQERMEKFRAFAYSDIADKDYVKNNVVQTTTSSEAVLNNLSETITVCGYQAAASPSPSPSATPSDNKNQWVRNSAHANGQEQSHDDKLVTQFDLLKVDILITWQSANGRTRTRELAALFGKGNSGQ